MHSSISPKLCMLMENVVTILKGDNRFSIQRSFSCRGENADFLATDALSKFNTGRLPPADNKQYTSYCLKSPQNHPWFSGYRTGLQSASKSKVNHFHRLSTQKISMRSIHTYPSYPTQIQKCIYTDHKHRITTNWSKISVKVK